MRFWNPHHAAAYRIVEDALAYYGAKRIRLMADHLISVKHTEETFNIAASTRFAQEDEQTYLLFSKLARLNESNESMFESVKSELKRYSSTKI